MRRPVLPSLLSGAVLLMALSCGESADARIQTVTPSKAELDEIDAAAGAAVERITPETAEQELEKLRAELYGK